MRGFELKKIVNILWKKPSTSEEKTPIVKKKHKLTENGTITMDESFSCSDEIYGKKFANDSIDSRKEETPEGMSVMRKLCFFLSLNGGVLFVAVLGWLLPCRTFPCLTAHDDWTSNLTSFQLNTNLETNAEVKPSTILFGYSNKIGNNLGALNISDGRLTWSKLLISAPREVFCHSNGFGLRINGDPCCIVTSDYFMAAFNSLNGNTVWERNITFHQRINKMSLLREVGNTTYLMALSKKFLHLIDVTNGTEISTTTLPCSWIIDVKLAGPWLTKRGYFWSVICEYGDGMEVFTFKERELLNFTRKEDSDYVTFKSLFSQQSYSRSIDLAGDVTSTSRSLVLAWSDMVVMVTTKAPSHHLHKTWERRFSNPLGYEVDVTRITSGYFTGSESLQVAAAVCDIFNSTIHILDGRNGSTLAEVELLFETVIDMKNIPGDNDDTDIIIIETIKNNHTANKNFQPEPLMKNYYVLQYENKNAIFKTIVNMEDVYDSNLSTVSEGLSNLLLAKITEDGNSIINRYIIRSKNPHNTWCRAELSKNTSTLMFFE